jgi:hypothetical protein
VRIQGLDAGQEWTEMSTVKDASPGGVAFLLRHKVARGEVLLLSLPLPKRFRAFDPTEASYHVYALVRDLQAGPEGLRVGVMFLGKHPPRGFNRSQENRYLLPEDGPLKSSKERRQHSRLEIHVNIRLRRVSPQPGTPHEEITIAENIGRGGARVLTSLPVLMGEVVELEELGGSFSTRAEIRNIFIGPDKIPRLNLRFLDRQAPDHLAVG